MDDPEWFQYQLLAKHALELFEQRILIDKALATTQLEMMQIERNRPDIMQRIILDANYSNNET